MVVVVGRDLLAFPHERIGGIDSDLGQQAGACPNRTLMSMAYPAFLE